MSNPINPDYPIHSVETVEELMDIAAAMEDEAARRYDQLARRVDGQPELAALFSRLAELERAHLKGLEAWAARERRRAPVAAGFSWRLPETFGDEADERPLDPYQALAIAVRNEERAFAFYTYLAAQCAGRAELAARAEALGREELKHVALLRAMRRRAFHARDKAPARSRVHTLAELHRLAAEAETAEPSLAQCQEMLETYLAVAEQAGDQAVLDEALRLAEAAMGQLVRLRQRQGMEPGTGAA